MVSHTLSPQVDNRATYSTVFAGRARSST